MLALAGAARGARVTKLALYDVALKSDGPLWSVDHAAELRASSRPAAGGDAVEYFQVNLGGIPAPIVAQMRSAPFRPALLAMADTLLYEAMIVGDGSLPSDLVRSIRVAVLAMAGLAGVPFMRQTAEATAQAVPKGRSMALEGQTHDLDASVIAPLLARFFADR